MNLPPSIESLTETRSGDPFAAKPFTPPDDLASVFDLIRQKLSFNSTKAFDEGVAFFRLSVDDKSLLKNIIELYIEMACKNLNQVSMDDELRSNLITYFKANMSTIEQLIEHLFILMYNATKDKKIIDINQISCNILGYAIETFRRNNNLKSQ